MNKLASFRQFVAAVIWIIRIWPHVTQIVVKQRPNLVSQTPSRIFWIAKEYHR